MNRQKPRPISLLRIGCKYIAPLGMMELTKRRDPLCIMVVTEMIAVIQLRFIPVMGMAEANAALEVDLP